MSTKTAAAIRHVHFEDLGSFEEPLTRAGYELRYYDVGRRNLPALDPAANGLVIVLGAPIGVYEESKYPFLGEELDLLKARIAAGLAYFRYLPRRPTRRPRAWRKSSIRPVSRRSAGGRSI